VHHLHDTMEDATSNANHGNATPQVRPSTVVGVVSFGVEFDGTNDFIELDNESNFDFANIHTVSLWLQVSGFQTYREGIVTKGTNSWRLQRDDSTDELAYGTQRSSGNNQYLVSNTPVNDGQWRHVAVVYDGGRKYIYLDGVEDASTGYTPSLNLNNRSVYFGDNAGSTGRYFNGLMDEVRISSVGRSAHWINAEHASMVDTLVVYAALPETY
jgi:hypothetical protein